MTIQDYDEVYTLWQESGGIELGEVNSKDAIAFWKKLGWAARVKLVTMSHQYVNGA